MNPQNFLKSFSELGVEDGVNERVEAGVDVAKEGGRLEREVAGARVQVVPVYEPNAVCWPISPPKLLP